MKMFLLLCRWRGPDTAFGPPIGYDGQTVRALERCQTQTRLLTLRVADSGQTDVKEPEGSETVRHTATGYTHELSGYYLSDAR